MNDNHKTNKEDIEQKMPDDEDIDETETSEVNYTGVFLAIGAGLGISFGIIFDQLSIGISLGAALGLIIGGVVESTKNKNQQ